MELLNSYSLYEKILFSSLGMSTEEIDRLHTFRSKNKWVNSEKEFQRVTKISDSLLKKIAPDLYTKDPGCKKNGIE